ncbi:MAG TPA: ABC transporter substrate-binding protein [Acidimicrobiales bacterium]|nr:ABC transporter substrate-binding protein [Acidimicrobiales bacterium]
MVAAGVVLAVSAACSGGSSGSKAAPSSSTAAATTTTARPRHPQGGTARVGVWGDPNPDAATLGGAAVRSLVLPQLFVARPDGTWAPSLVEPGSDRTAPDSRTATLRLRPASVWSDGTPVTADDLRRSADARFVAGVDGPAPDGTLTLRFTQTLPGWRRLWSGADAVTPPRPGLWGGPFVLAGYTPGLEAVLRANDRFAAGRPYLDELHLVLVPDSGVAYELLDHGQLDVLMPPAGTVRTTKLRTVPGVSVDTAAGGGWRVALLLRQGGLTRDQRAAVAASVDRGTFVGTLLQGEAVVDDGYSGAWKGAGPGDTAALKGTTADLVGELEEPMTPTLQRSMQLRAHPQGGRLELRNAEADRVEGWVAAGTYQAAIVMTLDGPVPCWTCRWASVDEARARAADAGDQAAATALEAELRDQALLLPLWRPTTVVAVRNGLHGVAANGYALSGAWNAGDWWRSG